MNPEKKISPFISLRYLNVRLLLFALFFSQASNQMQTVAINWHMYTLTHSAFNLGLLGLAGFLPIVIFSLVSGTLVDKHNKKKILVASQIILGINALLLFSTTIFHAVSPMYLYGTVALNAFIATFNTPSRQSILPVVVPKHIFMKAVSMNNIVWQIATILGPTFAGFLIALYGTESVYLINIIAFLVSAIILSFLTLTHIPVKAIEVGVASILEGIHFVRKSPLIYSTMLLDFFATFFASATTLMPIFAKDILHVGAWGLGILYAAPAVGAVCSGVIISAKHKLKDQGKLLIGAVIVYGIAIIGFGFSKWFLVSLLFLAISGAGDTISAIIRNTVRQLYTPDHLRGRMVAINMNFFIGGPYLGETEAGIAAGLLGTPLSVVAGGVGTIVFTLLIAWLVPKLRLYKGQEVEI